MSREAEFLHSYLFSLRFRPLGINLVLRVLMKACHNDLAQALLPRNRATILKLVHQSVTKQLDFVSHFNVELYPGQETNVAYQLVQGQLLYAHIVARENYWKPFPRTLSGTYAIYFKEALFTANFLNMELEHPFSCRCIFCGAFFIGFDELEMHLRHGETYSEFQAARGFFSIYRRPQPCHQCGECLPRKKFACRCELVHYCSWDCRCEAFFRHR